MIKKLRVRFIRIATVSTAAVLLLLCLILNIAHFATVNGDLTDMLVMIAQNRGRVPCQEQDCKQLCKRIVYTFYVLVL